MDIKIVVIILVAFAMAMFAAFVYVFLKFLRIRNRYKKIIDIENEVAKCAKEQQVILESAKKSKEEYLESIKRLEELKKELAQVEENLDVISYGLYKPHFDFDTSERYKVELNRIYELQKDMIRKGVAVNVPHPIHINGNIKEGARFSKQYAKLMLMAFNGEADTAIAKIRWNNVMLMEQRIRKDFEAINKLGGSFHVSIATDYLELKINELRLAYEHQQRGLTPWGTGQ